MKTLVLFAHPNASSSTTMPFFEKAASVVEGVVWHSVESVYKGQLNVQREQTFIKSFDRIVFQFPMYWYSCPANLKQYVDDVFTRKFTIACKFLSKKELGLVVTTGDSARNFQAGSLEKFTFSELLRPFEAIANKTGMRYLRPLVVDQFQYKSVEEKQRLLVEYLQYLNADFPLSLHNREIWLLKQLDHLESSLDADTWSFFRVISSEISKKQDQLDDLKMSIKEIRDQEE
ncbi:NAD(P)H-dependent oxidoreductase [Lactiplantibacillus paraplantarum]|uniref:NAD(P)H-dependent oxidoreductase n=1 Tax=Lactiplantibacillus TaxID=2767842 RepID=UPI00034E0B49|nr:MULTISPECIES: NAD(P)H-dependent oxidoreductase [Lactiplantibacillus]ARO02282.1 NADPH dehydrogenase [Lactiplantibacillus plantarum]ARO05254.1 NADPH dehydrogenase [Lactiplantibacillus plantarum]EPD23175.1 NAD(P)H dehydrogenase (quinone) [Lactiplantibacillus plantarum IPLA88]MCT0221342.1 flavodoxin family protein [Lactiplantibacillus plantarum]